MGGLGEFDEPFEEQPRSEWQPDADTMLAGAIVVMATVVDVPNIGPMPGLMFRFTDPAGEFYPPTLLLLDHDRMTRVGELVTAAIETAVRGAS
jgi:hypothetical protein